MPVSRASGIPAAPYRREFLGGLLAAGLPGCSPLVLVNALAPRSDSLAADGLPYGPEPRQKLDLYVPGAAGHGAPVVVFFYGGSWKHGERGDYRFVGEALAEAGIVAVLPDYRLYPKVRFPAFVADAARAVGWAADNVSRWGGDPGNLYLMGHSAGAHIAALVTLDEGYLAGADAPPPAIRGTIGLAGPYSFNPLSIRSIRAIFAEAPDPDDARPVTFVDGTEPPMLLLHGAADGTVSPGNSAALARRIRDAGGQVRHIEYPEVGHSRILLSLAKPFRDLAPAFDDSLAFIRANGAKRRG